MTMPGLYGSLTNRLAEREKPPTPEVGMGATICYYSDRAACTVVAVERNGRQVVLREDRAIRTDDNGESEAQEYRYEPDPKGTEHIATLRRNGRWRLKGRHGDGVRLGVRDAYYDYSM